MKYVITLTVVVSLLFCNCKSSIKLATVPQEKLDRTYSDSQNNQQLIGQTSENRLKKAPFDTWFNKYYGEYTVDEEQLATFKHKFKGVQLTIFMATWCGDSRRTVPKFLKIMDYLKFPKDNIQILNLYLDGTDYKKSPDHEEKGMNIHRVPTFIFHQSGKEIGRIVEDPTNTLETDIAQIFLGVPSKPQFRAVTKMQELLNGKGIAFIKDNQKQLSKNMYYIAKSSNELNGFGYLLLRQGFKEQAVAVFEINALAFSRDPNVFDSLAEGYMEIGEKDLAIQNYEKTLKMESDNENAVKMLKKLKKERS